MGCRAKTKIELGEGEEAARKKGREPMDILMPPFRTLKINLRVIYANEVIYANHSARFSRNINDICP